MTTDPDLAGFFRVCQERVEQRLRHCLGKGAREHEQLRMAMEHATLKGGKRIRPVLAYGAALAAGGRMEDADCAACAVELIHCYSLVHDDLPAMDDDDLRRGLPTVHKAYGEAMAILTGDALQTLAFQVLAETESDGLSPTTRLAMIRELALASGANGMVAGQALDFSATGKSQTLEQVQFMHSLKTGALIRASVLLGARSSLALEEPQLEALEIYAACIGLAFQIQDDILDVTTETATLGKTQGADQVRNKPTYTTLLGVAGARDKARNLSAEAVSALADLPAGADPLRQLAAYIVERVY